MFTPQLIQEMMKSQLPYETDAQKEMVLSIAKKVYTKMRKSHKIPYDVVAEVGEKIKTRDYYYLSMTFSKPGLHILAKSL